MSIESTKKQLYSSKHHILLLKKSLHNFCDKKVEISKRIEDINKAFASVEDKVLHCVSAEDIPKQNNLLVQADTTIEEIRQYLQNIRANEERWRLDQNKKDKLIRNYKLQKDHLVKEIVGYQQIINTHNQRSRNLETALETRKQFMKKHMIKAENREHNLIKSFQEKILELNNIVEIHENAIFDYKIRSEYLSKKVEEKNRIITQLKERSELTELIRKNHASTKEMKLGYSKITQNWVRPDDGMPIQESEDMNKINRRSWIQLVWSWWNNESQTQYLEKTQELDNTVKELHQAVNDYEELLEKMKNYFDRYELNENSFTKEIENLKEQIKTFSKVEIEYQSKFEKLETQLIDYKEQNLNYKEQIDLLEQKIKEIEQREAEYKLKAKRVEKSENEKKHLENKNIRNSHGNEKQIPNQLQKGLDQPHGGLQNRKQTKLLPSPKKQNFKLQNQHLRQSSQSEQGRNSKHELIKKYYPQAQLQSSTVFNPFKR